MDEELLKGLVVLEDGVPMTDSRVVAEKFGKLHKDVLKAIHNLDCSSEFGQRNFAPSEYLNSQGKSQPYIRMTRDGFTFLAMGFTGKDAARWKERYIGAFNAMESRLLSHEKSRQVLALEYVDRIVALLPNLGDSSRQQLLSDATEIDLGRRLIPLPVVDRHYSAGELAEEFGVSATKIGRVANQHGLKTPEFGEYRLSKSRYSAKQVEQFHYNEKGRSALILALSVQEKVA